MYKMDYITLVKLISLSKALEEELDVESLLSSPANMMNTNNFN